MVETTVDLGTTGAKQTSWEKRNARELVARIVTENPAADDESLFQIFANECAPYFMEICRYYFANTLRAIRPRSVGPAVIRTPVTEAEVAEVAAIKTEAKQKAKAVITERVLLDIILPNGKMLRDSTGSECIQAGGWLTRVGKLVQPNEKVGAVLTEKEVKAVFAE
jgi:hypothetical protein